MDKKRLKETKIGENIDWYAGPDGYDTVVFVHGILGNYEDTWGSFPKLIDEDKSLPKLDLMRWGYRTEPFRGGYKPIEDEAERFFSDIEYQVRTDESIAIVAHSMGGLVALRSLTDELDRLECNCPDSSVVSKLVLLTLMATPMGGSWFANLLSLAGWIPFVCSAGPVVQARGIRVGRKTYRTKRRLKDLRCADVHERTPGDLVTFQPVVGLRDRLVSKRSGEGPFGIRPRTITVDGNHTSMKLPETENSPCYRAVSVNLDRKLALRLSELCSRALASEKIHSDAAAGRIEDQYEEQLNVCALAYTGGRAATREEWEEVLAAFVFVGSSQPRSISTLVRTLIYSFSRKKRQLRQPVNPVDRDLS